MSKESKLLCDLVTKYVDQIIQDAYGNYSIQQAFELYG